ncbi:hypothetical protein Aduo_014149 [Ancylostoma duodenale]
MRKSRSIADSTLIVRTTQARQEPLLKTYSRQERRNPVHFVKQAIIYLLHAKQSRISSEEETAASESKISAGNATPVNIKASNARSPIVQTVIKHITAVFAQRQEEVIWTDNPHRGITLIAPMITIVTECASTLKEVREHLVSGDRMPNTSRKMEQETTA